jgi:hypothetical protein
MDPYCAGFLGLTGVATVNSVQLAYCRESGDARAYGRHPQTALSHYQIEHLRNLPHFGFMPLQRLHATFAGPMPRKLGAFLLR